MGHTYLRLRLDHGLITEDRDTESLGEAREALCAIIAIQAAGRRIPNPGEGHTAVAEARPDGVFLPPGRLELLGREDAPVLADPRDPVLGGWEVAAAVLEFRRVADEKVVTGEALLTRRRS